MLVRSIATGKMLKLLTTFLTLLFEVQATCDSSSGCYPVIFDILDNFPRFPARSVSASSTCGSNSSIPVQYQSLIASDRSTYTCVPTDVQPIKAIDDETQLLKPTYWQSDKMVDQDGAAPKSQFIVFNFTDEFLLYGVIVKFMATHMQSEFNSADARPAAFSIEKIDSANGNWTALEHFARDCARSFPGIPLFDPYSSDLDFNRVYCEQYPKYSPPFYDDFNVVEYSPTVFYDTNNWYKNNASRFSVSAVRLFIHEPPNNSPMKSYVAISDVVIDAQCKCNGHADSCGGQNNATCDCQHNTTGQQCSMCLPLFNNKIWTPGTTDSAGICLACTCNGRASSCQFDQVRGHGVCNNCTGNSTGDYCNSCVSGFYINPVYTNGSAGLNTTSSSNSISGSSLSIGSVGDGFCLACNCNQDGTQTASLATCDVTTGQCSCKERVTLRDCSSCRDTFWGLSANNPLGCNVCNCNAQGSLGNTNMCNKTTGRCLCKTNVEGDTCDRCKPYTYKFDSNNPDGCTLCNCDPGASTSQTCDLLSGQCSCLSNIGGLDCRSPTTGNFVPRLDVLVLEPERLTSQNVILRSGHGTKDATVSGLGFVTLTPASQINTSFTSPYSAVTNAVLRYEKTTAESLIFLQGKLTLKSPGYTCSNGQTIPVGKVWNLQYSDVGTSIRGGANMGQVCLFSGAVYNIQITSPTSALLVDSVVFVLDTTSVAPAVKDILGAENVTRCVQLAVSTVRSARDLCAKIEYSLVAALLQRAVPCSCVSGALASSGCDPYSGDCSCLPGVLPPDCTQCLVDHYQFSGQTGCTACGCHSNGSRTDSCDSQGLCRCWPNVQGTKCNSCIPEYTGLHTGSGCTACVCNLMYSISNNCTDYGQCPCLPGVGGQSCTACQDGYYNLTSAGCTQCACDRNGSTERSCDMATGSCQCLPRAEGSTCSQCKPGFFGLGKWHPGGCISCFCWGHGQNCTSASGWYDTTVISSWPVLTQTPPTDLWLAEDANGTKINVVTAVLMSANGSQYAMRIDETHRGSSDIFYVAPSKFLGDKKSSYGRYLKMVLKPSQRSSSQTVSGTGVTVTTVNVLLTGHFSNVTLIHSYNMSSNLTSSSEILVNILMLESEYQASVVTSAGNTTSATMNNATYNQVMEVLGSLSSLKILAYHATVPDSAMDIISVRLEAAVDGSKTSIPSQMLVNNVENCSCQTGYTGSSCEECAPHFKRAVTNSTDPRSQCVPCECNSHGITGCPESAANCSVSSVRSCDPQTGVCRCQHHTKGDNCETCLPGYYGDARKGTKDDCLPCACPGIIVANETNVFANSCLVNNTIGPVCVNCQLGHEGSHCERCIDGYFGTPENVTNSGGACRRCECNGHADKCNTTTGECLACRNNTSGHNCEICAPGYFGDAVKAVCQPCACNFTGSTHLCDNLTGVCECLPGVSGSQCDVCSGGTFNLTAGVGCSPCNCYMNGSTSSICNKTSGQCPCTKLVTGQHCDMCLPTYWNVNLVTGCDACQCSLNGTRTDSGGNVTSCDVITGQCNCTLPGIVGRTCDRCSPVSKETFQHVSLIYIGAYPSCELCGECFDSWAKIIEEIGKNLADMNKTVMEIWSTFGFKSSYQINSDLTDIEDEINKTAESLKDFESLASQLAALQLQFSEMLVKEDVFSKEVDMLIQTQQSLSVAVNSLISSTDVVQLNNGTTTSLSTLRLQFEKLSQEAVLAVTQGNSSWTRIQSLIFIVSTPEERERQLREQIAKLMDSAASANQSLQLTRTLYETLLNPGMDKNTREMASISDRIANVSTALANMRLVTNSIQNDTRTSNVSLTSLLPEAVLARDKMLNAVALLQEYVKNASRAQKAADKLLGDVKTFKTVAEKAEQTIINSTVALLEYIAKLEQAENDLTEAASMSTTSLAVDIPSRAILQQLVQQISNSSLSSAEVASLKMSSQQAKFLADQSVTNAEKALSLSRDLNEAVRVMGSDIVTSRDVGAQARTARLSCDSLNTTINSILQQAKNHSDSVSTDVTSITQSAQQMQAEIMNATSCLTMRQLDVTNSVAATSQIKEKADSATSAQLQLLQTMMQVNSNNLADVSQTLSNLTKADATIRQVYTDLEQLQQLAQIEVLIQDLQKQNQDINDLDQEITQLLSQLDSIILLLQESGGTTKCSSS